MSKNNRFSIIIPCYNAERWIEQSIISACEQTYQNKEIIVCDNESTDGSLKKILNLQATKCGEIIVKTAPNIYRHSWEEPVNESLKSTSGDYFTILGADDFLDKKYVENVSKFLEWNPSIEVFQSALRGVDENNCVVGSDISYQYSSIDEFKKLLFEKCPVNTPTVFYKMSLYHEGLIDWKSEKWLGAIDYNLYFSFTSNAKFIFPCNAWLGYYYRWHKDQSTWGMHKENRQFDTEIKEHWKIKWKSQ